MRTEIAAEYIRKRNDGIYEYVAMNGDDEIIISKPVNFVQKIKANNMMHTNIDKNGLATYTYDSIRDMQFVNSKAARVFYLASSWPMPLLRDFEELAEWFETKLEIDITKDNLCNVIKTILSFCNENSDYWSKYPECFEVPLPDISIYVFCISTDDVVNGTMVNPILTEPKKFLDFVNDCISYELDYQFKKRPESELLIRKLSALEAVADKINSIFLNDKSDERNV